MLTSLRDAVLIGAQLERRFHALVPFAGCVETVLVPAAPELYLLPTLKNLRLPLAQYVASDPFIAVVNKRSPNKTRT